MSAVGKKIQNARNASGISVKQLAKKLGVSVGFLEDIESGRKILNEDLIKKAEKIMHINLDEDIFDNADGPVENLKETSVNKNVNKQWEDAFSHILKKIPVCDINFREIYEYRYLPIIDKKVDGYNPEKIKYIKAPDDSMRGFRIHKDDNLMLYENSEILNNSIELVEINGKRCIRQLKRLDANKVLIISHSNELKTETHDVKSFIVIGRCLKLEIEM
jgi:transcriptional regulator with XRE-family HTH domain